MSKVITTPERWAAAVEFLMGQPRLTFDTEYVPFGVPNNVLVGFSFSWPTKSGWSGFYVPLRHLDPATGELRPGQLTEQQVTPGLKAVLERKDLHLGGQNFKAEIQAVHHLGIYPTDDVFDTMLVGYLLNTNGYGPSSLVEAGKGRLGLKEMSQWVLGEKQTKLKDLGIPKEHDPRLDRNTLMRVDLVDDLETFADYAIADTNQTGKLWDEFAKRLEQQPKLKQIYWRIHREFMFCLADMEIAGAELDAKPLAEMRKQVEEELREIQLEIFTKRSGEDFPALTNPTAVRAAAQEYDQIDLAVASDNRKSPYYPRDAKELPNRGALGGWRKKMFARHGLEGHPVLEKLKKEQLRPWLISHPQLAHKLFNLGSDKDLQKVFFEEEKLPMLGEKFGKAKGSTTAGVVKVWAKEYDNKLAKLLLAFRMRDKLLGTYLIGLPRMLSRGRIHGRFNQTGARTGRLSSSEPNLQNQPKTKKFPVRRSYVPTGVSESVVHALAWEKEAEKQEDRGRITHAIVEGPHGFYAVKDGRVIEFGGKRPPMVMGVADYSQLEIRILAHMSQDPVLIDAVLADVDIHSLTARALFKEVPDDTPLGDVKKLYGAWRDRAKTANFGVIYGMGPHKFARDYGYTIEEAEELINVRWMGLYQGVAEWIQQQHLHAEKYGFVQTLIGQQRHLPAARYAVSFPCSKADLAALRRIAEHERATVDDVRRYEEMAAKYAVARERFILKNKSFRQAQNAPIQGTAANIVGIAQRDIRRWLMSEGLWQRYEGARMLLQVHDEVVMEYHPSLANDYLEKTVDIMEGVFKLSVPLGVSAALGTNWLDAKD